LERYFIWFENFAVNKIEPFESAFSLLNVLQIKIYSVMEAGWSKLYTEHFKYRFS